MPELARRTTASDQHMNRDLIESPTRLDRAETDGQWGSIIRQFPRLRVGSKVGIFGRTFSVDYSAGLLFAKPIWDFETSSKARRLLGRKR